MTAPSRTRVLHVVQNLNYGGMERVLADIVRFSDPKKIESEVLCLQYLGRFATGLELLAPLHVAPPMGRLSMLWPRSLARVMRRISPDVVHTHSGVWYKASFAAWIAGIRRVIHTEHGRAHHDPWTHRLLDTVAARRTNAVVAVSDVLADYIPRTLHVSASRVITIRNGVDTSAYRPRDDDGELRRELRIGVDAPIIGSIGRLEHVKGYDILLRAFDLLLRTWDGASAPVLVVAGEGAERHRLEQFATDVGISGRVYLAGWRDDPQRLHSAFTVFSLASRSEGTSISLLEAMSAGLCPVVTDVGGNAAVLGERLRHRLVPPESPHALADTLRKALRDHDGRLRDAKIARDRVVEDFSASGMVRAYERLYRTAWAGARAAAQQRCQDIESGSQTSQIERIAGPGEARKPIRHVGSVVRRADETRRRDYGRA
jgi:glycosyltransferase involved in cell wall biosynthesis